MQSPNAEPRIERPEEPVPFLVCVDAVAEPDESGMLPFALVLEEIKQALSARGMEAKIAHVSIRESREEILHAIEAAGDEEDRRRG